MVTFRAIASLTKRSDSWRIASFEIAGARGFLIINSPPPKNSIFSLLFHRGQIASFPSAWVERLNRESRHKRPYSPKERGWILMPLQPQQRILATKARGEAIPGVI
jgi:hypothetical protein